MKNVFWIIVFCVIPNFLLAKNKSLSLSRYIAQYHSIAEQESFRSGIPASIILAQAILESGFGNSNLCKRSNNHFGIKWKNTNDGDYVFSLDDEYDKDGRRRASRFVKYHSAKESFRHHSQVLSKRKHYQPLFKYSRTDYVNWAYGLKRCGYSTSEGYGAELIKIIRRYKLYLYDNPTDPAFSVNTKISQDKINTILSEHKNNLHVLFKFLKTQGQILEQDIEDGKVQNQTIIKKSQIEKIDSQRYPVSHKHNASVYDIKQPCDEPILLRSDALF